MTRGRGVQNVKGTRDLLPPETAVWAAVEAVVRRVFSSYGYAEIRTPILEQTDLFVRSVGESTDIVGKQMYTFLDKKGRSLTLRPENTAAVARAYVQHGLASWASPVRLFYIGPQFRYERPQKGRYRQFFQIGAELLGDPGPWTDIELLLMLVRFLVELRFSGLVVRINTVGDPDSRARYSDALRRYLEPHKEELGSDSQRRLGTNPLRILDTKIEQERRLLEDAPRLEECLSTDSREHFESVLRGLDEAGVRYEVDDRLVRGLDYYTRTVFEISSSKLGAHDAILGGGRYDGLIAELGGPHVPGIGFAIGLDRLIDSLPGVFREGAMSKALAFLVPVGSVGPSEALVLGEELRAAGVPLLVELSSLSVKAALKRAGRFGCRYVLLLGDDELSQSTVTVKDFELGEQVVLGRTEVEAWLKQKASKED